MSGPIADPRPGPVDAPELHVFLVHSHVTELVARGVTVLEALSRRDVLFLRARSFDARTPVGRREGSRSAVFEPIRLGRGLRVLERRGRLRRLDRRLEALTGGLRYHVYVPQTRLRWIQALLTHPACTGFSLIEEGLASYRTRAELARMYPPDRPGLLGRLCYGRRIGRGEFFAPGHAKAYALTGEAFPDLPRRVVVPRPPPRAPAPRGAVGEGIGTVLVFDGLSRYGTLRIESVLHGVERALDLLAERGVRRVHYKLHPAQLGSEESERVEAALAHRETPRLERLPDGLALEELAARDASVRFLVNVSSVGLYAALLGCAVESYARFVAEAQPEFAQHVDGLPRPYRERVRFLGGDD